MISEESAKKQLELFKDEYQLFGDDYVNLVDSKGNKFVDAFAMQEKKMLRYFMDGSLEFKADGSLIQYFKRPYSVFPEKKIVYKPCSAAQHLAISKAQDEQDTILFQRLAFLAIAADTELSGLTQLAGKDLAIAEAVAAFLL